jgi:hypothetical protein
LSSPVLVSRCAGFAAWSAAFTMLT